MFTRSLQLQQSWHSQQGEGLGMHEGSGLACEYSFDSRRPTIALSEGIDLA